jgi:hypothetical protein
VKKKTKEKKKRKKKGRREKEKERGCSLCFFILVVCCDFLCVQVRASSTV